jgi:hypothetical protein
MRMYLASYSGREKDWGTADAQEEWMIKKGLTSRLISYWAILTNQSETKRSFLYYVNSKKN